MTAPSFPPLRVAPRVVAAILGHAREAAPNECLGLLASRRRDRSRVVTQAVLLPSAASLVRAVADPQGIARVSARLQARGLIPRGYWHSHVAFPVHHSDVDDETMTRLLPAMADHNFLRPRPPHLAPSVTGPDEARLPLADGTALSFTLAGPPIPGLDAHELARWESVAMRYLARPADPRASRDDGRLVLRGERVELALGLPADARLSSRVVEAFPARAATMYSLVMNVRSETYVEALTVHDVDGRSFVEMGPCAIEVVGGADRAGRATGTVRVDTAGARTVLR